MKTYFEYLFFCALINLSKTNVQNAGLTDENGVFMKNGILQIFEQQLEKKIETSLEKLTTHPYFLKSVSQIINLNSKRMILAQKAMQYMVQKAELPLKKDQDKMLFLLQEMQFHIQRLENEIKHLNEQPKNVSSLSTQPKSDLNNETSVNKKKESLRDRIQLDSLN